MGTGLSLIPYVVQACVVANCLLVERRRKGYESRWDE